MFEYTMCVYLENTFSKTFALMSDLFSIFWVSLFWKLPGSPFEWPIHYFIFKILWIQMTTYLYLSTRNRFSTPKYGIKHVSHLCIIIWKKWDIMKNPNWRPSWIWEPWFLIGWLIGWLSSDWLIDYFINSTHPE